MEFVSRYPGTLEDDMRETKLMNDRKVDLKLALSEWGAHDRVRKKPDPPKPIRISGKETG